MTCSSKTIPNSFNFTNIFAMYLKYKKANNSRTSITHIKQLNENKYFYSSQFASNDQKYAYILHF